MNLNTGWNLHSKAHVRFFDDRGNEDHRNIGATVSCHCTKQGDGLITGMELSAHAVDTSSYVIIPLSREEARALARHILATTELD